MGIGLPRVAGARRVSRGRGSYSSPGAACLDVLSTPTDNPRVAISAGPRGAYQEDVLVQAPAVGRWRRSAAARHESWIVEIYSRYNKA
jgi:hypothetical protein